MYVNDDVDKCKNVKCNIPVNCPLDSLLNSTINLKTKTDECCKNNLKCQCDFQVNIFKYIFQRFYFLIYKVS